MQSNLKYVVLLSGLICAGSSWAESASDNLTRIEAETLVLKARERQLDVQSKIIAKQNEIAAKQADTDRLTQAAVVGNPMIRSVEGIGRTMYATLQLDNGNIVDVQAGDVLSNGMKVVSIKPNEVIAETEKKRRIRLATISHTPATFNPNFPGPGLALPPLLPPAPPRGVSK